MRPIPLRWYRDLCAILGARAEVLIGVAGPMTGANAWPGEQMQRGAELAVADINAAGGVLGEEVRLLTADDFCDPDQAVAAARKLVSEGVIFVAGHYCSGASIPASKIYEDAGVLMISPASTNPTLTELGRANVFRVIGRDDADGIMDGDYLADHWSDQNIAILHDNTVYGKGLADATREQLHKRGVTEAIYKAYVPGKTDYSAEIASLQAAHIAVLFVGGYHTEIALLLRAARDKWLRCSIRLRIRYPGHGGVWPDRRPGCRRHALHLFRRPSSEPKRRRGDRAISRRRLRPRGVHASDLCRGPGLGAGRREGRIRELLPVIESLHEHEFSTVLGPIAFDAKGDLTTQSRSGMSGRAALHVPVE